MSDSGSAASELAALRRTITGRPFASSTRVCHRDLAVAIRIHTIRCHNPAIYCSLVGREATDPMAVSNRTSAQRTDHPHYASVVARLRPGSRAMPAHVIIPNVTNNGPAKSPGLLGGYRGAAYDPRVLSVNNKCARLRFEARTLA